MTAALALATLGLSPALAVCILGLAGEVRRVRLATFPRVRPCASCQTPTWLTTACLDCLAARAEVAA